MQSFYLLFFTMYSFGWVHRQFIPSSPLGPFQFLLLSCTSHSSLWTKFLEVELLVQRIDEHGTSLVAKWLRICLPVQGTGVGSLGQEDPTCHGGTKPGNHNYRSPHAQSLCSATRATTMKSVNAATRESVCAAAKTQNSHKFTAYFHHAIILGYIPTSNEQKYLFLHSLTKDVRSCFYLCMFSSPNKMEIYFLSCKSPEINSPGTVWYCSTKSSGIQPCFLVASMPNVSWFKMTASAPAITLAVQVQE